MFPFLRGGRDDRERVVTSYYSLVIAFNIGAAKALNYAVVSHFVAYFPLLIIGFFYFLVSNTKINDVKNIEISK